MNTRPLPSIHHPSRVLLAEAKAAFDANPTSAVWSARRERLADYVRWHPSRKYILDDFADYCIGRLMG